ncbi:hypothetical protein [Brevundimonas albigilva]|uniref:Uncharacterized protein n=1 Tax=Brevundimonas albigilva TaxID=1312364 RepID=A0ABY4SJI0_9CAUL|nr:hypothetical protein [Brevundimonas albigilva]URI14852.1 hypothetical protein M8231_13710 [Brevundimonas albigilva]
MARGYSKGKNAMTTSSRVNLNEGITDPTKERWLTFQDVQNRFPSDQPWRPPTNHGPSGFVSGADEASNLINGLTLLAAPQPLSFDSRLTVRYVGRAVSDDGCFFLVFLFEGGSFDVLVWVEDDEHRAKLLWRGDQDDFLRSELMMRMFEGRTLEHLR